MKQLVLAEKPSQGRDIAAGLGRFTRGDGCLESDSHIVTWAVGHLVGLAEPEEYDEAYSRWALDTLPIMPDKFKYAVLKNSGKQFRVIKKLTARKDVDSIVIATDPGREGELIARLILRQCGVKKPVYRMWTSQALTPEVVRSAFQELKPDSDYDRLALAGELRQQADWLVGINATRAVTAKTGELFSLGRVQTPTLALIANREAEIRDFRPQDYWNVEAEFKSGENAYKGAWFRPSDASQSTAPDPDTETEDEGVSSPCAIMSAREAEGIAAKVAGKRGRIESVRTVEKTERPPFLFSLTTLQQTANRLLGFTAAHTLDVAQSLYERHHCLSYPRTGSQRLGSSMVEEAKAVVAALGRGAVRFDGRRITVRGNDRRVFDDSKLTDHHALMPTRKIPTGLNSDEQKLYELVVRRFLAAFYPDHKYRSTVVITEVEGETFRSVGRSTIQEGWKELFPSRDENGYLPVLIEGSAVEALSAEAVKKQTQPPARYTDASILRDMTNAAKFVTDAKLKQALKETAGLGTEATRAGILKTLEQRGYVERRGKSIQATPKGEFLIAKMKGERVADVAFTALWEQALDEIAEGKERNTEVFVKGIREYTAEIVKRMKGEEMSFKGNGGTATATETRDGKKVLGECPECGREIVETQKGYGCSGYKEGCKFVIWKDSLSRLGYKNIKLTEARELLAKKLIKLKGLVGKSGKEFDCQGRLAKDPKYGWKIELVFDER